jgi:uncharacterized protein
MLTTREKSGLQSLLAHAVNPEEALNLDQLAGYLFGVVITPDVTGPSEWFLGIFGESSASFADQEEADAEFRALMDAYNRFKALRLQGRLKFPFEVENLSEQGLAQVRDWAVGLDRALALRSGVWMPDEVLEQSALGEDEEEIMTCLSIVLGVGHPEQIPEIFNGVDEPGEGEEGAWATLVGHLPLAVKTLQAHADELERARLAGSEKTASRPLARQDRIGRNDPCPCGGGKMYKKCCGLH